MEENTLKRTVYICDHCKKMHDHKKDCVKCEAQCVCDHDNYEIDYLYTDECELCGGEECIGIKAICIDCGKDIGSIDLYKSISANGFKDFKNKSQPYLRKLYEAMS